MSDNNVFKLPYLKKEQLTNDTYTFFFKRTQDAPDFTAGQYYEMKLDIKNPDERGDSRVFTISSSPTDREFISITTRIIQSSFKLRLNELKEEEIVEFGGPWDDLNFEETDTSPHVFIAGGIGVTPFHSIVKYVTDKNLKTPMILFVSWKNRDEVIFDDFFRSINNQVENFSYVPTLTDDEGLVPLRWTSEVGRIDRIMLEKYVYDITGSKYYFAGPQAMVKALKQTVKDLGVPDNRLISEDFEGY